MNLLKLFLLTILLGVVGGAAGFAAVNALGRAGALGGAFVVGGALVAVAGYLSARWGWIARMQRVWAITGGVFGFALACMVALATIASPGGLAMSTVLIGTGAVLGAIVGKSPHGQP
jgi:hypothetical protein